MDALNSNIFMLSANLFNVCKMVTDLPEVLEGLVDLGYLAHHHNLVDPTKQHKTVAKTWQAC